MSSKVKPSFKSSFLVAGTGPIPITRGNTPAVAIPNILTFGLKPYFFTALPEAINNAAAPSFIPEAFPATRKLLLKLGLTLDDMDIIELNEAFASQSLACTRELGIKDEDPRVNPLGGAIALGHPLGMSGARIVTSAYYQMQNSNANRALCTMCIGVGQGIAMVLEKV